MKTLLVDIETSPHLADVWGLFQQNVSLNQLHQASFMMCFAAKWMGTPGVLFYSYHHDGKPEMVQQAWNLMDEADAVVHWNGSSFDIPVLNREFLTAGLPPPSPSKQIDLMQVVKKRFRFASNKLQHVSTELGLQGKVSHEGHSLWTKCLEGDEEAWSRFREYNIQDTVLLEDLYQRLLPWIKNHPNMNLYREDGTLDGCPNCGSDELHKRGFATTQLGKFQRLQCQSCGTWSRESKRIEGATIQGEK